MIRSLKRFALACSLVSVIGPGPVSAASDDSATLRVHVSANARALPFHAGIASGVFARHRIRLELQLADSSRGEREELEAGAFDIAHSSLDNALAMIEAGKQVVIVCGGDSGMTQFFVQPDVSSFADLRGRTVVVDAPDTSQALQARKILLMNGLKEGDDYTIKPVGAGVNRLRAMLEDTANAAAILNLPLTVQAEEAGLKSLGRTIDWLGPLQAAGGFVMRSWASDRGALIERYLAAYVEALRWVLNPAHKATVVGMLIDKLKLSPAVAERTHQQLLDPAFGFTPDAEFDFEGFRNLLALRSEFEGRPAEAPQRYVDLGYYGRAMQTLSSGSGPDRRAR